jgi:hypothetical protein
MLRQDRALPEAATAGDLAEPHVLEARIELFGPGEGESLAMSTLTTGDISTWEIPWESSRTLAEATVEVIGAGQLGPDEVGLIRLYPFSPFLWRYAKVGTRMQLWNDGDGDDYLGEAIVTAAVPAAAAVG